MLASDPQSCGATPVLLERPEQMSYPETEVGMWGRSKEPTSEELEPATVVDIPLPEPDPELMPERERDERRVEHCYFDPARWNSETVHFTTYAGRLFICEQSLSCCGPKEFLSG